MANTDELTRARESFMQGDPDSAADRLETLLEAEPENVPALLLLARCYSRMRMGEDAVAEIETALELEPDNAEAHALRGAEHYFADELDEAQEELDRALELDPQSVEAHVRLAQVRIDEKGLARAAELLEKAEELAGEDSGKLALVRMGQVYHAMQSRDNSRALRLVSESEDIIAENPYVAATIRSNEAIIYARQRNYARARELLVDVLELDPYFSAARSLLGQIATIQKDYAFAADQLRQVVENRERVGAQVYYSLASSLSALGDPLEAGHYYRLALQEGLGGFPGLTAKLAVMLPDLRMRLALGAALLAVVAFLAFRTFAPFMAAAIVFAIGLFGWQIIRGR